MSVKYIGTFYVGYQKPNQFYSTDVKPLASSSLIAAGWQCVTII